MSTIHYRNARVFVGGYEFSGDFNELGVELKAEMLDETAFGDTTRIHKGGLKTADVTGGGHWQADSPANSGLDGAMFAIVGVDDTVVTVFANGITEGTSTDKGFSTKAVVEEFTLNGDVASLLEFAFAARGRGIGA